MLPETTRTRIEREADEYARTYTGTKLIKRPYIAGATAEAEFNRKEIEDLKAWKESASAELGKIQDWGHGNKTLPLGASITDEAVKRLKAYDELRIEAQRLADALEKIIEWANDSGMKEVAIDDKKGMALYHSKHLALNALQQWRGK
jgi:hypothetical protein